MKTYDRVYIDSVIWIGALDPKDNKHKLCEIILKRLLKKAKVDTLLLSDYVFAEVLDHISKKQKYHNYSDEQRQRFVNQVISSIYDSRYVKILKVTESEVSTAVELTKTKSDFYATLTDWLSLVMMVDNKIEAIATIDSDFKKIVKEISEFSNIKIIDK